ncbi:claspin-like [Acropora muricata]|uniref:claspin-like n=1 Tax=Acropora muricata TaxID=159855 RepID=UPI0034E48403
MSSTKMVNGAFLAEHELEQPGIPDLRRAVIDAIEAVEALRAKRDILKKNRELKRTQEQELRLSELEDRRKRIQQTDDDAGSESAEEPLEETVVDSDEVRQRRMERFAKERQVARNCDTEGEEDQDNSETVIFNTSL